MREFVDDLLDLSTSRRTRPAWLRCSMRCHPRTLRVIEGLAGDWRQLDERIEGACHTERRMRTTDDRARDRPIISSAMVAAIGTGDAFAKGRDFAAWLGLLTKLISTETT